MSGSELPSLVGDISFQFDQDWQEREAVTETVKVSGRGAHLANSRYHTSCSHCSLLHFINNMICLCVSSSSPQQAMLACRSLPGQVRSHTPMRTLGQLLRTLCSHPLLVPHLLKHRSSRSGSISTRPLFSPQLSLSSHSSPGVVFNRYQLHYGPSYAPSQLMRMIVEIFRGVPEGFAVFHCRPTTSAEELNLFIERMRHHSLPYLVLQVNRLPFKLQEVDTHNTHKHVMHVHRDTYRCVYMHKSWFVSFIRC